jgi:hypothetical protein
MKSPPSERCNFRENITKQVKEWRLKMPLLGEAPIIIMTTPNWIVYTLESLFAYHALWLAPKRELEEFKRLKAQNTAQGNADAQLSSCVQREDSNAHAKSLQPDTLTGLNERLHIFMLYQEGCASSWWYSTPREIDTCTRLDTGQTWRQRTVYRHAMPRAIIVSSTKSYLSKRQV